MPFIFGVLFFVEISSAVSFQNAESNSTLLTSRIYNGEFAQFRDYMVYLRKENKLLGTGFFIAPKIVVTAAHLVYDLDASFYVKVRVVNAAVMINKVSPIIPRSKGEPIKCIAIHPDFDSNMEPYYPGDVAVILLRDEAQGKNDNLLRGSSSITISPTCVESSVKGYVLGWGPVNDYGYDKYSLQKLELTVVDNMKCQIMLKTNKIRSHHMCAISPIGNTAREDAGGPFIIHAKDPKNENLGMVVGVAIFSNGNASSPSVYARMSVYEEFITRIKNLFIAYATSHTKIAKANAWNEIKQFFN